MKVSLKWTKRFTTLDMPVDELVERIGAQLGAVDEVIDLGKKYQGAVIAKVISAEKHPNADKLKLCFVDDGGVVKNVDRDSRGYIQVVCGAPNVAAGQLVVWLPPGVTVPNTYDKDPFVLEARELRGKISNGMIASAKELALGDDHTGILVLDDDAVPGQDFAKAYELDDYIIDIENKMFTHRPDLFGMLGIARELAGIQSEPFKSPDWYSQDATIHTDGRKNVLKLQVKNELPELVPRFCAVAMKDIKVQPSHLKLQILLLKLGVRPINNIVDITNFIMLLTGQPMHAYDYDKLKTGVLGARHSKEGEKLTVIGGKEISLKKGAIVITDGQKPVGLGGVMGGASTEVDKSTKNIILESANFDMNSVRRTAMEYGLFTDAATRFTKNQSQLQNMAAMVRAIEKVKKRGGGRVASPIIDDKHIGVNGKPVETDIDFINSRLGLELQVTEVKKLLENVEFEVKHTGQEITVTAPFWRTDIEIPEDIVEEVGRLYGYDKLPVVLPKRDLTPAIKDPMLTFKSRLRQILKRAGANEVLTYSFAHESLLKKAGQDPNRAFHIRNALSPDLQYYRLGLTPSLLDKVNPNIKAGYDDFALFEIGKGHVKGELDEDKLPKEFERLSLVVASKNKKAGAPFYAAKSICNYLLDELGIKDVEYRPLKADAKLAAPTYFEPARSAEVWSHGVLLGRVGEYKSSVKSSLKLPSFCAGLDMHVKDLLAQTKGVAYQPLNRFPELEQDFTLRSAADIPYAELNDFMSKNMDRLAKPHGYGFGLRPLDIFQKDDDKKHKRTTWRIILWHPERTLTTQETNKLLDQVAARAKQELKAERV